MRLAPKLEFSTFVLFVRFVDSSYVA